MSRKLQRRSKRIAPHIALYGLWLLLAALGVLAAFQLQVTLLHLGIVVVQNPDLRPVGWNTSTITGINRCTLLVLGALWLGLVIYSERYLRDGLEEHRLLGRGARLLLIIVAIYALSAGVLYLAG